MAGSDFVGKMEEPAAKLDVRIVPPAKAGSLTLNIRTYRHDRGRAQTPVFAKN